MEFGLNLYSIRNLVQTEGDFLETANKLREMGYSFMQFSGAPYDADMVTRVSKASGLPVVLTHVPMDRILNDTECLMEEHARFGCKNIGLGGMLPSIIIDEKEFKKNVDLLNAVGEKMKRNGFNFFYHNHAFEFYKHNGETVLDYMIKNAPFINFTLDTYWVQFGGASVLECVKKLSGRIGCVHLKDYMIDVESYLDNEPLLRPKFALVGDGVMNFKEIVPAMIEAKTEFFIVEQDNAANFDDPLNQVARSINYLKKEF